ncbi:MAG: ribosomal protein S18-alanine N-acetyltransferase [Armatimonadetes bacterium]|nr:ribosomal protein S18-alanine N-acetyltransferase [Armatimonadota bacterium]
MAIRVYPYVIDVMRRSDVPEVNDIERRCYTTPWHEDAYYNELGNCSACYLVAKLDHQVVGYTGMWVIMDEAHITTLAVDTPYRRQKVGERLFNELLHRAVEMGAERATLEVRKTNLTAQNLYRKYLFREIGVRRHYYSDNQEDALVMWAENLRTPAYLKLLDQRQHEIYLAYDEYTRDRNEL